MEIIYDQPIEVSKSQYGLIMTRLAGVCAGKQMNGKYTIKVWLMKYVDEVKFIINNF